MVLWRGPWHSGVSNFPGERMAVCALDSRSVMERRARQFVARVVVALVIAASTPDVRTQGRVPTVLSASVPVSPPVLFGMTYDPVSVHVWTDGQRVVRKNFASVEPRLGVLINDTLTTWRFEKHDATSFDVLFTFKGGRCDPNSTVLARLPLTIEVKGPPLGGSCRDNAAVSETAVRQMSGRVFCRCPKKTFLGGAVVKIAALDDYGPPRWQVRTDEDGRFVAPAVPQGLYSVTVSAAGFFSESWRVRVASQAPGNRWEIGLGERPVEVVAAEFAAYPKEARSSGLVGEVVARLFPGRAPVVSGPAPLSQAAAGNLATWRFAEPLPTGGIEVLYRYALVASCDSDRRDVVTMDFPTRVEIVACR